MTKEQIIKSISEVVNSAELDNAGNAKIVLQQIAGAIEENLQEKVPSIEA